MPKKTVRKNRTIIFPDKSFRSGTGTARIFLRVSSVNSLRARKPPVSRISAGKKQVQLLSRMLFMTSV